LALSLKFLSISLVNKQTRKVVEAKIQEILFGISLPLFLTSKKDLETFVTDPVEYVRL
jgi:hypothetical protein